MKLPQTGSRRAPEDGRLLLRLLAASAQDDGTVMLRLLSAAVEHSPDGVVVSISDLTDPRELQIVYANPAFERFAREQASSLVGRSPLVVCEGLLEGSARTALAEAVQQRISRTIESRRGFLGRDRSLEIRAVPFSRPGEHLTEWVWTFRDITRRVRREQRRRASLQDVVRAKDRSLAEAHEELRIMQRLAPLATLAAGLGHDISNLLLPMRAHLEGLANTVDDPSAREHLAALHSVLQYLQRLTDSLRLMALDPERPLASEETTTLSGWWRTTGPLLSSVLRPSIRLAVELPEDLPRVRVAPHLLTLAILNLLMNAVEALPGEGEVRIRARSGPGSPSVRIEVSDDGCGMSPEVKRRAFDPFFSTKRRRHAAGLGLALVHSVVRSAGGGVQIDTTEGEGTTVVLILPIADALPDASSERMERMERTAVVRVKDARIAACLETMLTASGFARSEDPDTCSVFVTDPSPAALDEVRRLRSRGSATQVFTYGAGGAEWSRLGAVVIEREAGPSALRRAFSRLAVGAADE